MYTIEEIQEALWHLDLAVKDPVFSLSDVTQLYIGEDGDHVAAIMALLQAGYVVKNDDAFYISDEGRMFIDGTSLEWKTRHLPIECHSFQK